MIDPRRVAIVGGGVIGGGWAARFVLNGIDVAVHDPNPEAPRIVGEVVDNARRAYRKMLSVPLCREGHLTFAPSIAEAVEGADYIQESIPERIEIKRKALAEIERAAPGDAIIGSSTSNFTPTELQEGRARPERILVVHPFNPVYLLPLAEIVASARNTEANIQAASDLVASIGMKPLRLRKEILAHAGNRLLEAAWRESLWLIKDGVVTTEELDDVVRFGLGLRFAQMGQFESYRIAGGEGGMRHFIGQFGPTLSWPLTKLMDVPEFDDALVDLIASQSDDQSGAHTIRELERIRDDNLVSIIQGLRANNWGAGKVLDGMEARMRERTGARDAEDGAATSSITYRTCVPAHWADHESYMTAHRYAEAFSHATDGFLSGVGLDGSYLEAGFSILSAESHVTCHGEVTAGTQIEIRSQLVGRDETTLHLAHEMHAGGDPQPVATAEVRLVHVDAKSRKRCPFHQGTWEAIGGIWDRQGNMARPDFINKAIAVIG